MKRSPRPPSRTQTIDDRRAVRLSKFMSYALRHRPDAVGLELDAQGWVRVQDLLAAAAREGLAASADELARVVAASDKQRFALDETGTRIRANQGHSVQVDLGLTPQSPPDLLWHGTVARFLDAILAEGLVKGARQHVHLSVDAETARAVGQRRGAAVLLRVDAGGMRAAGHAFYCSDNGVWLTEHVPARFLSLG